MLVVNCWLLTQVMTIFRIFGVVIIASSLHHFYRYHYITHRTCSSEKLMSQT